MKTEVIVVARADAAENISSVDRDGEICCGLEVASRSGEPDKERANDDRMRDRRWDVMVDQSR